MAQRYGDVGFVADGKTYTVRYGNLAWDALKRKLGAPTEIGCLLKARESTEAFLVFVREGLATYHPDLSADEVRQLYDELPQPGEKGLNSAAWEAVELALPELKKIAGDSAGPKAQPAASPSKTPKRSSKPH